MAVRLNHKEQARLLGTIERLTHAGMPQKSIAAQLVKFGSKKEQAVGESCLTMIKEGRTFSRGLEAYLTQTAFLALMAGEQSGRFSQGVTDACSAVNMTTASAGTMMKVLIKPALEIIALLGVSALTATYLYPLLEAQLPRTQWAGVSLAAQAFGAFWWSQGLTVLLIVFLLSALLALSLGRWTGELRLKVDNGLVYRQYRHIHCTNLLTAVAHQLAIGVSLKQALTQYQVHSSPYIAFHIDTMLQHIARGATNVGHIFDTGLLLDEEMECLKILGGLGDSATTLKQSAQMHAATLHHEVNSLNTIGVITSKLVLALTSMLLIFGTLLIFFSMTSRFI